MKIAFTLDYELFLGSKTGSIENCLINPLNALEKAMGNAHFTIFVDATYIYRISQLKLSNSELISQYDKLVEHLLHLRDNGHDLQLHIHPHWAYSSYKDGQWLLDHDHYKLSDLDINEAATLVNNSKQLLDDILGYKTTIFRAGGFSAQPTKMLASIFDESGIIADSTVCPGTSYNSTQQQFNYISAPSRDSYYFDDDICKFSDNARFIEFPLTMYRVSPLFHWKLACNRLFSSDTHKTYGDGIAVKTTSDSIIQRLTRFHNCPSTIDGYKANFLTKAYINSKKRGLSLFTVLGHPKLATPYSVGVVEKFVKNATSSSDVFVTLSELIYEQKS